MHDTSSVSESISALKCCVIIPTYNNQNTLKRVIDGVLPYTEYIIIINDGATDSTPIILKDYPFLEQIHFSENRGKGSALRAGFKAAAQLGYEYAITIDSDGQHYPEDIPVFVAALEKEKNTLFIGARNMVQAGAPKGNSFGHKFSNFWYWVETGIRLEDTQSGYRLYPLKKINELTYHTNRFEFEIEVIVRAAWNGLKVKSIPIKVLYDKAERVTHFRPYIDFGRITILNTFLVTIALLYIKPRDFFRSFKKKGLKRFFFENILHHQDSPRKKALSIALGVFIGIAPFWGFQTVIVLFLAALLRLNKMIAFACSNISIPPFIPFIIFGSLKLGQWVTGGESINFWSIKDNFDVTAHIFQYIIGSFLLASIAAVLFGGLGYLAMEFYEKREVKERIDLGTDS